MFLEFLSHSNLVFHTTSPTITFQTGDSQTMGPDQGTKHQLGLTRSADLRIQPQTYGIRNSEWRPTIPLPTIPGNFRTLPIPITRPVPSSQAQASHSPITFLSFQLSLSKSQLPLGSINHVYFFSRSPGVLVTPILIRLIVSCSPFHHLTWTNSTLHSAPSRLTGRKLTTLLVIPLYHYMSWAFSVPWKP